MNKTNLLTKLLLLCLCVVGSVNAAWADDKYYILGAQAVASDGALTKASSFANLTIKYIKYNGSTYSATEDVSITFANAYNNKYQSSATSANIDGIMTSSNWGTGSGSAFASGIKFTKNNTYTLSLGTKTISKISFLCYPEGKKSSVTIDETEKTTSSKAWILHEWTGTFTGDVDITISNDNGVMGVFMLETPPTPTLTGAWKISSTDVTGETAVAVQGSTPAPTVPTFDVGATSGTPASADYSVVYSLKDGSDEGIFTYTSADGPTAISTANAGSATIVATLTTANASKFLTPATNTFEYTVTVSAASAPEISIDGDASVARGGELTLTATVEGVPTPTVEWFQCDDALKTNPVSQGEASTSNTSFAVPTTTVGTYYFYAKAVNGSGNDESDVKTITVVPKAPTLTAGGNFYTDSKSVTIAKADGESEDAVIKYSTDGGSSWSTYDDALSITATTTVQAKVVQSGLESTIESATYTKFAKSELVSINAEKTWTLTSEITIELTENTTTPSKYDSYYTYSDIATINATALPTGFDGTTLAFSGQYPFRGSYGAQNSNFQFQTTVPGKVTVEFSNTNGSNKGRWVKVNNTTGSVEADGATHRTENFEVGAGLVTITHVDKDGNLSNGLRVYTITFTPTPGPSGPVEDGNTVTLETTDHMAGWRAYYNADNNYSADENTKVYVAASDPEGDVITLTPIAGVPAGVPVILHGNTTIKLTKQDAGTYTYDGNNILAVTDGTAINNVYRLGWNSTSGVGFYPYSGTPAEGTVYLNYSSSDARALTIAFDEDGETTAIKAIDNEQLTIDNYYDLQGRKVAQPQKGLYIVNGKKVIVK